MFLTATLRQFIDQQKEKMHVAEFVQFQCEVDFILEKYLKLFRQYPAGAQRGQLVQSALDREIEKNRQVKTSCQKGCSYCCHFEVEISSDDAAVIVDYIAKSAIDFDLDRAVRLSKRQRQGSEWKQGVVSDNRCLFLDSQGACGIYVARPSSCRKMAVISDPIECSDPLGRSVPRLLPLAEIILSAALNAGNVKLGSLPKMLVDQLALIPVAAAEPNA